MCPNHPTPPPQTPTSSCQRLRLASVPYDLTNRRYLNIIMPFVAAAYTVSVRSSWDRVLTQNRATGATELLHGGPFTMVTVQKLQQSALKECQLPFHLRWNP
jgi:hypothetical protein